MFAPNGTKMKLLSESAATECAVLAGCGLLPVATAGTLNVGANCSTSSSFASMTPRIAAPCAGHCAFCAFSILPSFSSRSERVSRDTRVPRWQTHFFLELVVAQPKSEAEWMLLMIKSNRFPYAALPNCQAAAVSDGARRPNINPSAQPQTPITASPTPRKNTPWLPVSRNSTATL